jgi:transposase-like protein
MAETSVKEKTAISREDRWRDRIGAQARSGRSVQQFCKEQGFSAYSFYSWRRRLREEQMLRFALVDRGAVVEKDGIVASLELILNGGERLRIGAGADTATLRTVLEALRS